MNPDWARGQTTSMQCGLRAVPPEADGVLFTLVDHPAVAPATIDALLAGPRAALLRVPRYHGRRGHPIWFSRELDPRVPGAPRDRRGARRGAQPRRAKREFLDLDDPGILADIDDPEAYRGLTGAGA